MKHTLLVFLVLALGLTLPAGEKMMAAPEMAAAPAAAGAPATDAATLKDGNALLDSLLTLFENLAPEKRTRRANRRSLSAAWLWSTAGCPSSPRTPISPWRPA